MADIKLEGTRDRYGETLIKLAEKDKNVVSMDCDLGRSTRAYRITEVDKSRFFEMGIAEQDMISTAAGMAKMGKIVFANSFAIFITGRAYDQVRQQVALPKLNVKICGSSGGLTQGPDGATHQSVLDYGIMRLLPNMTVFNPSDGDQTEQVVNAAYEIDGPVYIRLSRYMTGKNIPAEIPFAVGKGQVLKEGKKVLLCGSGPIMKDVNKAGELLADQGVEAGIANFHTLKPFDEELIADLMGRYELIVTVEEHSIFGGLGTAVAESMAKAGVRNSRLFTLGVCDTFGESGTAEELLCKHGINAEGIAKSVKKIVEAN